MTTKVEGGGWLGFHGIGGGGAMLGASAFVARGFKIANYADTSGDPPASKIYSVIRCILEQPVDGYVLMGACLANQEQWHHAHALVKVFKEEAKKRPGFPVIMLIGGNKEKETHEIIREGFKNLPCAGNSTEESTSTTPTSSQQGRDAGEGIPESEKG